MRHGLGIWIVAPALLVLATGCATRDWVRETLGKKEVEIDKRIVSVDQRVSEESQRVEGMGFRLTTVETGLGETTASAHAARERAEGAAARAEGAFGRAEAASNRADEVDSRFTRLWSNRNKRDLVEAVQLHFAFDKWELSDAAQTSLATLVKELRENPRLTVDLEGYADPAGGYTYNVALSQRRVEAVRRYLVEQGIALPRIYSVGLGPILDQKEPDEKKRRVTVKLMVSAD
ncbi:MAG: OmpA family protein [Candidatus Rokubacteria bacterium]|nr:OmpA family protein [Candidatus Rokubacteria bacterium]